ncbi:hypothetical protein [Paraburkholderia silvatlantica]|uniref:Uncharacterized protein n=1 Tax=Paraburkholderia silvatlantica TaxID=321895 RepID=A0ABR6FHW1_9BURK|nr:hypothetical protein [Paraburkholderia silvatlantica]MBB2926996.1 hypothetical protein [Paraburkholderia silvatlantica]PVY36717.1 hypothetical protein C7411_1025 [Paraburkholderia silvatlantica]PXW42005.1 hypothetical protein C7413_102416 [Paraburkholderia silvatlantica]
MPVIRSYPRRQWEALGRRLDALPEKPKDQQSLKITDGVNSIHAQMQMAREKGYTLNELIEQAAKEGIDVGLNSLRYAMRRMDEKMRIQHKSSRVSDKRSRQTTSSSKTQPPIDNRTGSTVIRDSFSFEIRPDVEDL